MSRDAGDGPVMNKVSTLGEKALGEDGPDREGSGASLLQPPTRLRTQLCPPSLHAGIPTEARGSLEELRSREENFRAPPRSHRE